MLEKLRIKNFQCHALEKITFDPAITVIVGPSDVGKSAVIRALRWLVTNRPRGDEFIMHGTAECEVGLRADGNTVLRRRGTTNSYSLDDKEFVAFRDEPPEEIAQLLNMGDINFQGQHDPVFWFTLTPGQVAREINHIVDLGAIDKAVGWVGAQLRAARAEVDAAQRRSTAAQQVLGGLAYVPALVAEAEQVKGLDGARQQSRDEVAALAEVLRRVGVRQLVIAKSEKFLEHGSAAIEAGRRAYQNGERCGKLKALVNDMVKLGKATRRPPPIDGLVRCAENVSESTGKLARYAALMKTVGLHVDGVRTAWDRLVGAKEEFKRRVGDNCPVCGKPTKWE